MTEKEFYKRATNSRMDLIGEFLKILKENNIHYCVIGGLAVNAYCEPMVTLDFDCVVVIEQLERLRAELKKKGFKIKSHPHTWEVKHKSSDVRIQIQRDKRYQEFINRAELHKVLGYSMRVANIKDLLKGKGWACIDPERDELKREKDLLDIKRIIRTYPDLKKYLNNFSFQKCSQSPLF